MKALANGKAVVAMSGGVDSSLAAALMVEQGWDTIGVTLKLLARADTGFGCCGSPVDIDDAKRVCETLGIPHYTLNLSEIFEDKVIKPFIDAYLSSRTPNPCVECNRSLKFGYLLALVNAWGAQCLATGHYARVENSRLYRAKDGEKDQTYFLYSLTAKELEKTRFPIGELTKTEVRARARALKLKTADKPESQEICFVPRKDYRGFIESRAGADGAGLSEGPIEDSSGNLLGRHTGLASYTIGQRKGFKLAHTPSQAVYVVDIKTEANTLVVGPSSETFGGRFTAEAVSWASDRPTGPIAASVRIRHRHPPAKAKITPLGPGEVEVEFEEPQRAVTPGQAAVFYRGDEVLGGGTISGKL